MTQIVILDQETLGVTDWYFADSPIVPVTPGIRLEVPEGLTWDTVKGVQSEDGTVTLVEDPAKLEAKTVQAWRDLRSQRNSRLAASDWTQLADTHMSQDKKDAWAAYRQELRDLPETLTSPTDSVVWPLDPTQQVTAPSSGSRRDNLLGQI
jgi:Phage tail assembly chaperone protein